MKKIGKKGISPMIATVLLIGFVISIILLVLLWGKGYIEELAEKRGILAEKQQECTNIQLEVPKACWSGHNITEIVIRNKANIPIHKFVFRAVGAKGEPVEVTGGLGGLETKSYTDDEFPDLGTFDVDPITNVDIIPHLKVALGHYVPCSKQMIRVRLTDNCS